MKPWTDDAELFALACRELFTCVVVVPRGIETEVFSRVLEKARGEATVQRAIEGGMSAKAAFDQFGIM